MSKENTVVSGRYFARIWKCWLYPLICLALCAVLGMFQVGSEDQFILALALSIFVYLCGAIAMMWFLYADATNLRKTHGLKKGASLYIIAFWFIGIFSLLIYYWTRSGLVQKAGMIEESLTWKDRLLRYENRDNIPYSPLTMFEVIFPYINRKRK